MIDAALYSQLEPCLQALGRDAAIAPRGRGLPSLMRRAQWNVAVLAELATPGRLVLIPVVGRLGRVSDFMWQGASPTVTLLLGCAGVDLTGRTLTQILGACHLRDVLFQTCHQAFLSRSPQTAAVNGDDWQGRIDARPSSAGLTAAMTSSSAIARVMRRNTLFVNSNSRQASGTDPNIACVDVLRSSSLVGASGCGLDGRHRRPIRESSTGGGQAAGHRSEA
ncbi:MAG: hypothetical protein Q8L92_08310, partial [Rubrivivax sp.]|nr:hypothetical protein [Rubrivivax sp.]